MPRLRHHNGTQHHRVIISEELPTRHGDVGRTGNGRAGQRNWLLRDGRHDAQRIRGFGARGQGAIGLEEQTGQLPKLFLLFSFLLNLSKHVMGLRRALGFFCF